MTSGIWAAALEPIKAKAISFAAVVITASALLASLVPCTVLGAVETTTASLVGGAKGIWHLVDAAFSVRFLALLFAAIHRVVPKAKIAWGDFERRAPLRDRVQPRLCRTLRKLGAAHGETSFCDGAAIRSAFCQQSARSLRSQSIPCPSTSLFTVRRTPVSCARPTRMRS
jgi:hypothetical protein